MAKLMAATLLSKCPCKSGNKSRFRKYVHERKVFTALTAFLLEEPDQLQRSRECFISSREKCRMVSPMNGERGNAGLRSTSPIGVFDVRSVRVETVAEQIVGAATAIATIGVGAPDGF